MRFADPYISQAEQVRRMGFLLGVRVTTTRAKSEERHFRDNKKTKKTSHAERKGKTPPHSEARGRHPPWSCRIGSRRKLLERRDVANAEYTTAQQFRGHLRPRDRRRVRSLHESVEGSKLASSEQAASEQASKQASKQASEERGSKQASKQAKNEEAKKQNIPREQLVADQRGSS